MAISPAVAKYIADMANNGLETAVILDAAYAEIQKLNARVQELETQLKATKPEKTDGTPT